MLLQLKDFRQTQELTNRRLEDSINAGLARLENAMKNTTSKLNDTADVRISLSLSLFRPLDHRLSFHTLDKKTRKR